MSSLSHTKREEERATVSMNIMHVVDAVEKQRERDRQRERERRQQASKQIGRQERKM